MDDELYLNAISVDWDQVTPRSYLRDIPAIAALTRLELHAPVTFFAGENGSGKSTLIEAIAVAWGFRSERQLLDDGAEVIVHTAEELEREILR